MSVVVSNAYAEHARRSDEHISLLTADETRHLDVRPLRVAIINLMPQAERYEASLLSPLGRSLIHIEPIWIRLNRHAYKTSDHAHLDQFYGSFQDAVAHLPLDGMILTGAPVEHLPFEHVTYWQELSDILNVARSNIPSTIGICWGGLALAKMLGIEKILVPMKIFGVFESRNLDHGHPVTGSFDDVFACAESRHAAIPDADLEAAQSRGLVRLLAHAEGAGYEIFESTDRRFLMHLGHPEYRAERFAVEFERDLQKGRTDVPAPRGIDLVHPVDRWRIHGAEFFGQWIRYLHAYANTVPPRIGQSATGRP